MFYIYILDAKYVLTFQATGCPGHHPPEKLIERWKSQEKYLVLDDMLKICNLAKKENSRAEVKEQCCESNLCKHMTCVRQRTFIQGPSITSTSTSQYLRVLLIHLNDNSIISIKLIPNFYFR